MAEDKTYFIAVDQSTTASKVMLFTREGKRYHRVSLAHKSIHPQEGWAEHNPIEILHNVYTGIARVLAETSISTSQISHLSLTNQRETVVFWDSQSGEPIHNALVWYDQRGKLLCDQLADKISPEEVEKTTGLILNPFFSASKLAWLVNEYDLSKRAQAGEVLWGTIDSWLIWNLTKKQHHVTDYSNACRTLLLDITRLDWDDRLLKLFGIPRKSCPNPISSDAHLGPITLPGVQGSLELVGVMGDSQAALFGQRGLFPDSMKATFGTGTSIVKNLGKDRSKPLDGVVTSIGWGIKQQPTYVLEGNIHSSGQTINWIKDNLSLVSSPEEAEALATSVPDSGGVYLVPAFTGMGAPYWDTEARAILCGLHNATKKSHIARAAIDSIAYQVFDLVQAITNNQSNQVLLADGGATKNQSLMQFLANLLDTSVLVRDVEEASALGAGLLGGLGIGFYKDVQEIMDLPTSQITYNPKMEPIQRKLCIEGWHRAVKRALLT